MKPTFVVSLVEFLSLFPGKRWLVPLLALLIGGPFSTPAQASQFASGSYTGNGVDNRAITPVGFQPDVVIIKSNTDQLGVMRTATMVGDASKELSAATALQVNRIQSLDANGFTVGNDAQVNSSGVTYYWMAFRVGGAGDLRIASYTGNGVHNRWIAGVGFTPDYVVVMPEGSKQAVQRSSAMTGDTSFQFDATGPIAKLIQAFNADGFQVGKDARVNGSGLGYHYVAWKAAAGSYAGNGADNRDITGAGFPPGFVIKSNGNDAAVHRPGSLSNDSTLLFTASGNVSNVIQALRPDGFQVGSDVRANRSGTTYFWMAFGPEVIVDPGVSILAITSVNGGTNPTAGAGFPVTVQANRNVAAATDVALTLQSGIGTLGGTLTGTIPAGQSQVTISGITYSKAESGVVLTANRTSGDYFAPGDSAPFTVNPGAISSYTVGVSSPQAVRFLMAQLPAIW